MEWNETTKFQAVAYASKITTPRTAKNLINLLLARVDVLERANASFGESMEKFSEHLPDMIQNEMDRRVELHVKAADELESPAYGIIEKGGKQPPNPPPPPAISVRPPEPPN